MQRRTFASGLWAVWISSQLPLRAEFSNGQRLAQAARAQIGVTLGYDPNYTHVSYPNGDVPRSTGVCADVHPPRRRALPLASRLLSGKLWYWQGIRMNVAPLRGIIPVWRILGVELKARHLGSIPSYSQSHRRLASVRSKKCTKAAQIVGKLRL